MGCKCKNRVEVKFAKVKPNAIIPSKRDEDAGLDIYACFDEDYIVIRPLETKLISTGIKAYAGTDWWFELKERGSNGVKGIGQRAGVIEGVYQGEWFVPITNHNDVPVIIVKNGVDKEQIFNKEGYPYEFEDIIFYPYEKGICQAVLLPIPKLDIKEITEEELMSFESIRGTGALGSSGK